MTDFRFLLDQNFPDPPFDIEALDRTVRYEHFSRAAPELARVKTPDFMVHLVAQLGSFTGVVTRDKSQLDDPTTLVALTQTNMWVVTWKRKKDEDIVAEWGQLLAYMPQIRKLIDSGHKPGIITLPSPRLNRDDVKLAETLVREIGAASKTSYGEVKSEALKYIRAELALRKRPDLSDLLTS